MSKIPIKGVIRVRAYDVLARAVENGVSKGWNQAHAFGAKPKDGEVIERIINRVMDEICYVASFDEQ
jgi:hypothetical protein